MKILFLSHKFHPDMGGIEIVSEILATAFYKAGHEIHLATWSVNNIPEIFPFLIIRRPDFVRLFKEHAWADVVFENNPCLRLSWPALFFNRPSLIALHTWIRQVNSKVTLQGRLKFLWLKRADQVIACSNAIRKRCWPSSIVIENPYNEKIFKKIGIPREFDFVFLGRLVSDKGADLAIRALHQLVHSERERKPDGAFSLTIIGDGPEHGNLKKLVHDLNLQGNVVFDGTLKGEQLVVRLNQHRLILIPSLWEEPFGIVALEGMACGCVPIVSDDGGLPDAIGDSGLTFRRGDVFELIKCIRKLNSEPELEKKLRDESTVHLISHYTKAVSDRYLEVINSVIARH